MNIRFRPKEKAASDLLCVAEELRECRKRKPYMWGLTVLNVFQIKPQYQKVFRRNSQPCDLWIYRLYMRKTDFEHSYKCYKKYGVCYEKTD